jgi:hypothetical protein
MSRYRIIEYQKDFFTGELKRAGELGGVYEGFGKQHVCVVPATPNENQLSMTLDYWRSQGRIVSAERVSNGFPQTGWKPPHRELYDDQKQLQVHDVIP